MLRAEQPLIIGADYSAYTQSSYISVLRLAGCERQFLLLREEFLRVFDSLFEI